MNIKNCTAESVLQWRLTDRDMVEAGSQFLAVLTPHGLSTEAIPFTCALSDSSACFADLVFH